MEDGGERIPGDKRQIHQAWIGGEIAKNDLQNFGG